MATLSLTFMCVSHTTLLGTLVFTTSTLLVTLSVTKEWFVLIEGQCFRTGKILLLCLAPALNTHRLITGTTGASMTGARTQMMRVFWTTTERLVTRFIARRNRVTARRPRLVREICDGRVAARTMGDARRRIGTRQTAVTVTNLLASMMAAVQGFLTRFSTRVVGRLLCRILYTIQTSFIFITETFLCDDHLAIPAVSGMAHLGTEMNGTGKWFPTNLFTLEYVTQSTFHHLAFLATDTFLGDS